MKLNISPAELLQPISGLEEQLCLNLFHPGLKHVGLTEEGRFLIGAFRKCLAFHDRNHRYLDSAPLL